MNEREPWTGESQEVKKAVGMGFFAAATAYAVEAGLPGAALAGGTIAGLEMARQKLVNKRER